MRTKCRSGTYQDEERQKVCKECGQGTKSAVGSTSKLACVDPVAACGNMQIAQKQGEGSSYSTLKVGVAGAKATPDITLVRVDASEQVPIAKGKSDGAYSAHKTVQTGLWQVRYSLLFHGVNQECKIENLTKVSCDEAGYQEKEGRCVKVEQSTCASTSGDWITQKDHWMSLNSQLSVALHGTKVRPKVTITETNETVLDMKNSASAETNWTVNDFTLPPGRWKVRLLTTYLSTHS